MTIQVLLVDDHRLVLDGLRELLNEEEGIEVVGDASNGRDAIEQARRLRPNVVVMDVGVRELNGISTTRHLLDELPETRVVGLSMHSSARVVSEMLRAGACGYVTKSSPFEQIILAIRAAMSGQTFVSPELTDCVLMDRGGKIAQDGRTPALSTREQEVLQLVAEGKSSKEIAATLFVATKTVEWHRNAIMQKLNIRSVAELTKYAIREGLTPLEC